MFELEGLSSPEIAASLEIPLGTVASRLRRAREQFRVVVSRLELTMRREGHGVTPPDPKLPTQLRVVGATDLERRLLDAGSRELPSVELTRKMQQALGLSIAASAMTAAAAKIGRPRRGRRAGLRLAGHLRRSARAGRDRRHRRHPLDGQPSRGERIGGRERRAADPGPRAGGDRPRARRGAGCSAGRAGRRARCLRPRRARTGTRWPSATPSDLRAEIALVDAARTAVATGGDDRALALLHRYDTSYRPGTFRPEAAALRIEALAHLGRTAQALPLAQRFIAAHPDSPLADRVARVTGLATR